MGNRRFVNGFDTFNALPLLHMFAVKLSAVSCPPNLKSHVSFRLLEELVSLIRRRRLLSAALRSRNVPFFDIDRHSLKSPGEMELSPEQNSKIRCRTF